MPLRKSPTRIAALAAAHRRNTGNPAGSRTARGRAPENKKFVTFEAGMLLKTKGTKSELTGDPNMFMKTSQLAALGQYMYENKIDSRKQARRRNTTICPIYRNRLKTRH